MDKNTLKYELGVENMEDAKLECLKIINNIDTVIDIKGLDYIKRFLLFVNTKEDI